jgi:hypothetical protein
LAEKAWDALQRDISMHVCPLIFRRPDEPTGTGQLLEASLTTDDYPGGPGARILKTWDDRLAGLDDLKGITGISGNQFTAGSTVIIVSQIILVAVFQFQM